MISAHSLSVAVVDEELPYPPTSGKRIRTLNLLNCLAERHRVTILCHRNADEQEAACAARYFKQRGIATICVDRPTPRKSVLARGPRFYGGLAWNLLSTRPYVVDVNFSKVLQRAIREHEQLRTPDLWHIEWTPYAALVDNLLLSRAVVVAHNVESLIWERYAEIEKNPVSKWYIGRQFKKFERFERDVFTRAQRTVAVSEADAALIRTRLGRENSDVVANGVDLGYFHDVPRTIESGTTQSPTAQSPTVQSRTLLFLGSLDWRPNLDAVQWLLDEILPRLLQKRRDVRVSIVGRTPPGWLVNAVQRQPAAELHANVPDVRPHLQSAAAMLVPLRVGGGTRLKILEAAAAGVPVVSTAIGAEGLSLSSPAHFLQADHPEEIVAAVESVLDNPRATAEMTRLSREHVTLRYGWPALAERLERVWYACAEANGHSHLNGRSPR